MRIFLLTFILTCFSTFAQEQSQSILSATNNPLIGLSQAIANEDFDKARTFLIDETVSNESLKDLKKVIDKVIIYIQSGIIKPSKEGSKQISITLRDSVIFLLEEDGKYYLTKGTTSNIPKLLKMAELLSTPEKTIDYFISKVEVGNLVEAATCFVEHKDLELSKEEASNFAVVLKEIQDKKSAGLYQGKSEKSLVSFNIGQSSVSLAKENSDWLFTLHTKKHINEIYSQLQQKTFSRLIPKKFHETFFLIKNWQWVGIFIILLLGIIAQWIFQTMFKKTVAKKLQVKAEDEPKSNFRSITILCVSLCWYFLFPLLGVDPEAVEILTNASAIMAMVSALFVVSRILDFFKQVLLKKAEQTDNKIDDVLIPMFHKLIKLATFVVGVVLIASNIGINVASLLAGIGLAGMAIALAAKDTVENLFGSITVLLDKPFEVGDWVVINGVEGTVEQIGLRSSRIRTFYCSQVNVPNSTLIQATVDNYGRRNFRRIKT
ncbi:MAG: mechanosensitive ion channel family protein, partial [Lentisphaeraceae bacterium]|nr:mechanosensitive ion channel family protein [Lentisphaeraceae bacterium]